MDLINIIYCPKLTTDTLRNLIKGHSSKKKNTKQHIIKILKCCTDVLFSYIFVFQIMEHNPTVEEPQQEEKKIIE